MDRVVQVGIRAQEKAEYDLAKSTGVQTFYATRIRKGEHANGRWQTKFGYGKRMHGDGPAEGITDAIVIAFCHQLYCIAAPCLSWLL